ncbi:MAG: hypothetical protein ACRC62_04710 [Microcoleus sp.]
MLLHLDNLSPEDRVEAIANIEKQMAEGTFDPTSHYAKEARKEVNQRYEKTFVRSGIGSALGAVFLISTIGNPLIIAFVFSGFFLQSVSNAWKSRKQAFREIQEGTFAHLLPESSQDELKKLKSSIPTPPSRLAMLLDPPKKVESSTKTEAPEPPAAESPVVEVSASVVVATSQGSGLESPTADFWNPKPIANSEFLPAIWTVGPSRSGKSLAVRYLLWELRQRFGTKLRVFYITAVDRPSESGYFEPLCDRVAVFPIKNWFTKTALEQAFAQYHRTLMEFKELPSDRENPKLFIADEMSILLRQSNYLKQTFDSDVGLNFMRDLTNTLALTAGGGKESGEAIWGITPNGAMGAVGMARHDIAANDPLFVGNLDAWNPVVYQTAVTNRIAPPEPSPEFKARCRQLGTSRIVGWGGEWWPMPRFDVPPPTRSEPLSYEVDSGESGLSEKELADLESTLAFLEMPEVSVEPPKNSEGGFSIQEAIASYLGRNRVAKSDQQINSAIKNLSGFKAAGFKIKDTRSALEELVRSGEIKEVKPGLYRKC